MNFDYRNGCKMNFDYRNGLIWISFVLEYDKKEVKIDNCILDTGSATTAIDIDLVDFNYRKSSIVRRLRGIGGGIQEVIEQEVDKIIIGDAQITNAKIEFGDIQEDMGINGFIGTNILNYFDIHMKFSKNEIEFKQL